MARKRKSSSRKSKKSPSAHTCSILKKRISSATTKSARGKSLGAYARAGCAAKARRRRKHRRS